jgi:predicted tellurium resistance membrane protein TerC
MPMLHEPIFWAVLGAIIWINLMVSGDNAVMIALGAALLGWIAGDIMVTDPAIAGWVRQHAAWLQHWHAASIAGALLVTAFGRWSRWAVQEPRCATDRLSSARPAAVPRFRAA